MSGVYPTLPTAPPVDDPAAPPSYDSALAEGGGLPPSYDELYGQFREVDSPSSFASFLGRAFEAISRTLGATVIFALLNIVPIGMIVIGSVNKEACPAQPKIPIWLIVAGALYLVRALVSAYMKFQDAKYRSSMGYRPHFCLRLFNFFLAFVMMIWFILGTIWILSAGNPSPDYLHPDYCEHFMFTFTKVFIIVSYVLLLLSFFACCCCCCFICCRHQQRERLNNPA